MAAYTGGRSSKMVMVRQRLVLMVHDQTSRKSALTCWGTAQSTGSVTSTQQIEDKTKKIKCQAFIGFKTSQMGRGRGCQAVRSVKSKI
jgi:hypothetical protein